MRSVISNVLLVSSLLFSGLVIADCTTNRNLDVNISKPDSIYIDHNDGTVTGKETGLMWQKCTLGLTGSDCLSGTALPLTWQAALISANTNSGSNYNDWRLPNKNELESLEENACYRPGINQTIFPETIVDEYWTSTPNFSSQKDAWVTDYYTGNVYSFHKDNVTYVRLVRNAQLLIQ